MKIKEALKSYYGNPLTQPVYNKRLKDDFNLWAQDVPGFKVLQFYIESVHKKDPYYPENVINVCNIIGCSTIEQLQVWLAATPNADILNYIKPVNETLKLINLKEVDRDYVSQRFPNNQISMSDNKYLLVPETEIEYILNTCPAHRYDYVKESRDCEDFCRIFRGWLSEQGYGNLAIPEVWFKCYKNGETVKYHAVVGILTEDEFYLAEPQKSFKRWKIQDTAIINFADSYEIVKLNF